MERNEELRIESPCPKKWAELTGGDGKRYCDECRLHVHSSDALTRDEAHALTRDSEGRTCMRIVRDADGRAVYRDSRPSAPRLAGLALAAGMLVACTDREPAASGAAGGGGPDGRPVDGGAEGAPGPPIELLGEVCLPEELGDVELPPDEVVGTVAPVEVLGRVAPERQPEDEHE